MNKINNLLLLLFLLFFSFLLVKANENKTKVDVIYFHATIRCHGCLTIEDYTYTIVNGSYQKLLKDSTMTIKSLDFLEPGNEHFQDDYKFEAQSLIISKKVNGKEVKWKNLDKIWDYSSDFKKFEDYLKKEIDDFIKDI